MLSRRNFLKLSGLGAVALGAGFGYGKMTNGKSEHLKIQAYLPDENSVADLTKIIADKLNHSGTLEINGNRDWSRIITNAYSGHPGDGRLQFKIEELSRKINSDLLVSDNSKFIYNPEADFNYALSQFRERISGREASCLVSVEYRNESFLNSLFRGNEKVAVIENEKGIFEKISLNKSYSEINLTGPSGTTRIKLSDGKVSTLSSCCRNGLCKLAGSIQEPGELIACAPNKILIRIEEA